MRTRVPGVHNHARARLKTLVRMLLRALVRMLLQFSITATSVQFCACPNDASRIPESSSSHAAVPSIDFALATRSLVSTSDSTHFRADCISGIVALISPNSGSKLTNLPS